MALMTDAYLLQWVWVALIVIGGCHICNKCNYAPWLSESPRKRSVVGANLPINVHRQNPMCVAAVRPDAVEVAPVRK